jgi:hypothetical protein
MVVAAGAAVQRITARAHRPSTVDVMSMMLSISAWWSLLTQQLAGSGLMSACDTKETTLAEHTIPLSTQLG